MPSCVIVNLQVKGDGSQNRKEALSHLHRMEEEMKQAEVKISLLSSSSKFHFLFSGENEGGQGGEGGSQGEREKASNCGHSWSWPGLCYSKEDTSKIWTLNWEYNFGYLETSICVVQQSASHLECVAYIIS